MWQTKGVSVTVENAVGLQPSPSKDYSRPRWNLGGAGSRLVRWMAAFPQCGRPFGSGNSRGGICTLRRWMGSVPGCNALGPFACAGGLELQRIGSRFRVKIATSSFSDKDV